MERNFDAQILPFLATGAMLSQLTQAGSTSSAALGLLPARRLDVLIKDGSLLARNPAYGTSFDFTAELHQILRSVTDPSLRQSVLQFQRLFDTSMFVGRRAAEAELTQLADLCSLKKMPTGPFSKSLRVIWPQLVQGALSSPKQSSDGINVNGAQLVDILESLLPILNNIVNGAFPSRESVHEFVCDRVRVDVRSWFPALATALNASMTEQPLTSADFDAWVSSVHARVSAGVSSKFVVFGSSQDVLQHDQPSCTSASQC